MNSTATDINEILGDNSTPTTLETNLGNFKQFSGVKRLRTSTSISSETEMTLPTAEKPEKTPRKRAPITKTRTAVASSKNLKADVQKTLNANISTTTAPNGKTLADSPMDDAMVTEIDAPAAATATAPPASQVFDFTPELKTPEFVLMLQQQLRTYGQRLEHVEKSHATIERLQRELSASQAALAATLAEVEALKAALAAATGPKVTTFIPSPAGSAASKYAGEYPALEGAPIGSGSSGSDSSGSGSPGSDPSGSPGSGPSGSGDVSWSGVAKSGDKTNKKKPKASPRSRDIAARLFTPISESQGFKYVYLPCRAREKYSDVRKKLKSLKIDSARILDVHYPAQKMIALLVHNDYSDIIMKRFTDVGVKPIKDFDPTDASVIRDPALAGLDITAKLLKARDLQRSRCLRALEHIRRPVCFAVAGDFLSRGWILDEDLAKLQAGEALVEKAVPVETETDAEMVDAAAAFGAETTLPVGDGEPSLTQ